MNTRTDNNPEKQNLASMYDDPKIKAELENTAIIQK